ncbi:YolD-like family protein [Brevibacillus daliensis]|uniref:YolD-like family protein n=1 Tax=Brevibacillus daliensis TaxID=2892995 RepID=UPI001E3CEFE6|nr:YolD-like family protein [Brevibacillus daliensis]
MASKLDNPTMGRFMMSEHVEALQRMHEDKKLIEKPILEEDELTEFCYRITDSRQFDYALTVSWWESRKGNRGVIETFWGWVVDFDSAYKRIKLKNDEGYKLIPVDDIVYIVDKRKPRC